MKRLDRSYLPWVFLFLLQGCLSAFAQPAAAPAGWAVSRDGNNWVYKPTDLPAGETFVLTIQPAESLKGKRLDDWWASRVQMDMSRRGIAGAAGKTQRTPTGLLTALETYRASDGKAWLTMYAAAPLAADQVQFAYMDSNMSTASAIGYFRIGGTVFGTAAKSATAGAEPATSNRGARSDTPTPAVPATSEKPLGSSTRTLSGLYMCSRFQVMAGFSSRHDWYFYFFAPDGHVYNGFPAGGSLDHFDFAAAAARDPKNTGSYRVSGDRIEFVWGGGRKPEASALKVGVEEVEFLGDHWRPAEVDSGKQTRHWLLGTFRHQMAAFAGGSSAIGQTWYTFRSDGTFEGSQSSAVLASAPVPSANRSSGSHASGTYTFSGTTLTLRYADGQVLKRTAVPYGEGAAFIDGVMYIR